MARRGEEVDDEVLLLRLHAGHALASAPLRAVDGRRHAFDVSRVRDRDHDVLLGNQILDFHVVGLEFDRRAAVVAELLLHLEELGLQDA